MPFVDVNGIPAYYDITGAGEPVLFLHGGYCSAEVMRELSLELHGYAVHAPERPGHGRTLDRPGAMHYADGLLDTVAFMDALGIPRAHVVGFSDGANIGLLLALHHPERVISLVSISGNLRPGQDVFRSDYGETLTPAQLAESQRVSDEFERLSPHSAEQVADVGARIIHMWETEPSIEPASLLNLALPVLVMAGDGDIIARSHTELIHESIPRAQLAIIPGTSHLLVRERPVLVGRVIQKFFDREYPPNGAGL